MDGAIFLATPHTTGYETLYLGVKGVLASETNVKNLHTK